MLRPSQLPPNPPCRLQSSHTFWCVLTDTSLLLYEGAEGTGEARMEQTV